MNPHDAPTAEQLVEAVRQWIESDVLPATDGRLQFHARVAINVLAMVERELALGPGQAVAHHERLAALGFASERELADAIRAGEIDPAKEAAVRAAVWETVQDKLRVAHPKYLAAD